MRPTKKFVISVVAAFTVVNVWRVLLEGDDVLPGLLIVVITTPIVLFGTLMLLRGFGKLDE